MQLRERTFRFDLPVALSGDCRQRCPMARCNQSGSRKSLRGKNLTSGEGDAGYILLIPHTCEGSGHRARPGGHSPRRAFFSVFLRCQEAGLTGKIQACFARRGTSFCGIPTRTPRVCRATVRGFALRPGLPGPTVDKGLKDPATRIRESLSIGAKPSRPEASVFVSERICSDVDCATVAEPQISPTRLHAHE